MKRAVLQPLCAGGVSGPTTGPPYPMLVGWVPEPVARLQVNGRAPREESATLMVVHLDQAG